MHYVIQKLGRDVKSIVLKFLSDQTISLRIIKEKQGSTAGEIHSIKEIFVTRKEILWPTKRWNWFVFWPKSSRSPAEYFGGGGRWGGRGGGF